MSEGWGQGEALSQRAAGITNTHIHLPPNFSAFATVEQAVESAASQRVQALGASNFHDLSVYARFEAAARRVGVVPLYGVETITLLDSAEQDGIRVNDPANPGRMYLCGKGIAGFASPSAEARRLMASARSGDEERMRRMVARMCERFTAAGIEASLTDTAIAEAVAARAQVPQAWVVLQERHVAMAFQESLFAQVAPQHRGEVLEVASGRLPVVDVDDPVGVQAEIRASLMKAGRPAFEPESQVSFEDGLRLILELGGIPCYPTLADGVTPVCAWEDAPARLAERVLALGIPAAELIPARNRPETVDAYVAAFRDAGIVVMAGTEHNKQERLPLEVRCADGTLPSPAARSIFWEGACVVAAHQQLLSVGRRGFVDRDGRLNPGFPDASARIRWFRELGAEVIGVPVEAAAG